MAQVNPDRYAEPEDPYLFDEPDDYIDAQTNAFRHPLTTWDSMAWALQAREAGYVTKDSGKREEYGSGMVRDTQEGKPRYDLIPLPFLRRWADLMARGAAKYTARNWELADSVEEYDRFKQSALRHMFQYLEGDETEDHAAAVAFNLAAAEYVKGKLSEA